SPGQPSSLDPVSAPLSSPAVISAFPPATTTVCLATGFFSLFVLRVQPTPVRLPVCTSIWPYTTSPSELVLRLDESLGVRAELSPPNAYRNVPFTPKPS